MHQSSFGIMAQPALEQNHYSYYGGGSAKWRYGAKEFGSLQELLDGTKQEAGSRFEQQLLQAWSEACALTEGMARRPAQLGPQESWKLESVLPFSLDARGMVSDAALRQLVILKSLGQQYGPQELKVTTRLISPDAQKANSVKYNRSARAEMNI
jgi:hypothetical protein